MAKEYKYGRLLFIIGILIGLLVGIILNFNFTGANLFDRFKNVLFSDTVVVERIVEVNKSPKQHSKIKVSKDSTNLNYSSTDSLEFDSLNSNNSGSKNEETYPDELIFTPLKVSASNTPKLGGVKVAKEELLYAMYAIPFGSKDDFLCRKPIEKDSTIANLPITENENGIYVEFWHSPLNIVGYKLSTNTLVLYGFYEFEAIRLNYLSSGSIRLKYHSNSFVLKCSEEFIPLNIKQSKND